jgi:hypothetical protein
VLQIRANKALRQQKEKTAQTVFIRFLLACSIENEEDLAHYALRRFSDMKHEKQW